VIDLNRAVAVGMAGGSAAGLQLVEALARDPALQAYPYLPATRADFLEKLGRLDAASAEYQRAASLTRNARERELLLQRAHRLTEPRRTS
jgi:predicted RNA polymerase sigma factor